MVNLDQNVADHLSTLVGAANVLCDTDAMAAYTQDWTGQYSAPALAVVRPRTTDEVAQIVRFCSDAQIAIVPQGGNTGLVGGGVPRANERAIILSLTRMKTIGTINQSARSVVVQAGAVLQTVQEKVAEQGLFFPLTFGARGSCTIGGVLSTNAGGVNVVRYGTARALCLGLEAVLPDGSQIDTLSGLRKDNTGYDFRDLLIGAEGTLGIITAANLRLYPEPVARVTGFLAVPDLTMALTVLNRLQDATGGFVEAFEYMPSEVIDVVRKHFPRTKPPLGSPFNTGLLFEIGTTRPFDAEPDEAGVTPVRRLIEEVLGQAFDQGLITDAMLAETEQHRQDLWAMRESVLESILAEGPGRHLDIALPIDQIAAFLRVLDPETKCRGLRHLTIGHLGDGNLHFAICQAPGGDWNPQAVDYIENLAYDLVIKMQGSVSAEHGIGQSKRAILAQRKQRAQLLAMRAIKTALDPGNIMNPGKMLPDI